MEKSKESKTKLICNTGPMPSMLVRIAQNLLSVGLTLVNKNTRFLCLLFGSNIG